MKKLILGFAAFAAAMAVGMVACDAQTDGKQRDMAEWHSGAYDVALGTNFASPDAYMRFERQLGGDGAAGGESGDAGAGSGAGAGGGTGGNGGGAGEGCSTN